MGKRLLWVLLTFASLTGFLVAGCCQDPVTIYDRLVIDTFYPDGGDLSDTYLILIDASGNVLAQDDNGNPDQTTHDGYSRIDYTAGLPAGTYYVRVNNDTGTGSPYYGIRAVDYDPGLSFPVLGTVNENDGLSDDSVGGNGVPTNPVPLSLGEAGAQSRAILPILLDKDWFELVLP
jgi:hypothetical protein